MTTEELVYGTFVEDAMFTSCGGFQVAKEELL